MSAQLLLDILCDVLRGYSSHDVRAWKQHADEGCHYANKHVTVDVKVG